MGVRTYETAPDRPRRRPGPEPGATLLVGGLAALLLLANGRPLGVPQADGVAGALLQAVSLVAGLALDLDETGRAVVGKLLAALCAAGAAGALFAAVARRHTLGDARLSGLVLAVGTTLAAASQSWSGEVPATAGVAAALLLLTRASEDDDPTPAARAAVPLGVAVLLAPSTWALALVVLAGTFVRWWRSGGLRLLAWATPAVLLALLGRALEAPSEGAPGGGEALALLFSPAHGLLVFAPVALVGLAGIARAVRPPRARHRWDEGVPPPWLPLTAGVAAVAHVVAVVLDGGWSTGPFWGPRLLAPAWPLLVLFLPEGLALLRVVGRAVALLSVAVQAFGALAYDGRWDRLHGADPAATWDLARSPIVFQLRERAVRLALPALEGRRLVVREYPVVVAGPTGSRVTFTRDGPLVEGVDSTLGNVLLEGGARVADGRLHLQAPGDALFFRVPSAARLRSLELRIRGAGPGTLVVTEKTFWTPGMARELAVGGSFRLRIPWSYAESGGGDLRIETRGGDLEITSAALVPPAEPEEVIRLR